MTGQESRIFAVSTKVTRSDSKIATKTCRGTNKTNGQACRNSIRSNNATGFCHKHADQAHAMQMSTRVEPQAKQVHIRDHTERKTVRVTRQSTPSSEQNPKADRISPAKRPTRLGDRSVLAREPSVYERESNKLSCRSGRSVPERGSKSLHEPSHKLDPTGEASRSAVIQDITERERRSFSFKDLWRALACIPTKTQLGSDEKDTGTNSSIVHKQIAHVSSINPVAGHNEDGLTPNAPVDKNLRIKSTTIGSTEQHKISVSPQRLSRNVRSDSTECRRFLSRYAQHQAYPHKTEVAVRRIEAAILNALRSSSQAEPSGDSEYIYVFRLDGDYLQTPRISVKIGRSKDVESRLKQWYLQCRYKIDRLDVFPTRHAVLVERMLHLEFEEDRVLKQCQCGRTHKEWFNIRREDAKGRIASKRRQTGPCDAHTDESRSACKMGHVRGGNLATSYERGKRTSHSAPS